MLVTTQSEPLEFALDFVFLLGLNVRCFRAAAGGSKALIRSNSDAEPNVTSVQ